MSMEKTLEEMKSSVLAYCEEVCPNIGDGHKETMNSGAIIHFKDRAWSWLDGLGSRIYINDNMSRATATAMYAILGLEARDAVAEKGQQCRQMIEATISAANEKINALEAKHRQVLGLANHTIKQMGENIEHLEARNTALVAALRTVKQYCESGNRGGATRLPASHEYRAEGMYQEVIEALAANTEKGGDHE